MNHTTWRESLERLEARLEAFVRTDEDGNDYYPPHPTLNRLYRFYDQLIVTGLEHGWLDLDTNGELA